MNTTLHPASFAIARSPLLPLSVFQNWCHSDDHESFILEVYDNPLVDEALYISSQSLHASLQEYRRGEGDAAKYPSDRKKLIATLAKFLSRAAYRCTPFGLFAQVQLAKIGASSEASPHHKIRRGIHLDAAVEARLLEKALSDRDLRQQIKWQISNTTQIVGTHLSYVDWVYQSNWQRTYRAVEFDLNEGLLILRKHCQSPMDFKEICNLLSSDPDISEDDAIEFLHGAIDRRLLLPDLAPSSSDKCTLEIALSKCPEHSALEKAREILQKLSELRKLAESSESLVPYYEEIHDLIKAELGNKDLQNGVLQIDSVIDQAQAISQADADRLVKGVQVLAEHSVYGGSVMSEYKNLFRERFEDREINLAYALHPELGLPYPDNGWINTELLDGLRLQRDGQGGGIAQAMLKPIDQILIKKFILDPKTPVIRISEDELKELNPNSHANGVTAEGLYAQVNLLSNPAGGERQIELKYIGGRNGLELISRFTHLSKELTEASQQYYETQRAAIPGAIYAEITHHPQDRILNILRKPRLAEYDLVFAGNSGLPRDQQFWLDDLSIQLVGERFVLRERKTGRRVIPRMTSAHNYSARQLGTYQFLAMLQEDDASWIGFNWPAAIRDFDYMPRVEIAGLIVSRARWTLKKTDIEALNKAAEEGQIASWRSERQLPRYVTWDMNDNHLPVDLENPASVSSLLDEIIKHHSVFLHECLTLQAAADQADYAQRSQEWILPMRIEKEVTESKPALPKPELTAEGKICPNMGEWAYLRIYTGAGYSDRVIREVISPVFTQTDAAVDRWFFIRYKDQFEHLRLRFHSDSNLQATLNQVYDRLHQARQDGLIWRVQSDDYVIEAQRYGGEAALVLCEQLFMIDSQDALQLLEIEDEYPEMHQRWLYALASVDDYAQCLEPEKDARTEFLDKISSNFLNEHSTQQSRSNTLVALGARFRDLRKSIDALRRPSPAILAWREQLARQRPRRDQLVAAIRNEIKDLPELRQQSVIHSLMHMHVNRLVQADPRRHETVLYDFAKRLERARQATQKPAPAKVSV